MIIKKTKSNIEKLLFSKKYAKINTINEEIIEDKEANLNNKDKVIQLIPKIKNNL